MLGQNELNVRMLVSRYIQYYTNADGSLDPQIQREAVLLGALLQRTDDEDKDIHRIAAVLSGVDLSR